jgi:hypothetical protein
MEVPKQDVYGQINDGEGKEQKIGPKKHILTQEKLEKGLVGKELFSRSDKRINVSQERESKEHRKVHEDEFILANGFMAHYIDANDKQKGLN